MPSCTTSNSRDDLLTRLKRIEGQVKGIQRMVAEQKSCNEVLVQIAATRAAINKVGTLLFMDYSKDCLHHAEDPLHRDQAIDELAAVLTKFMK